MALHLCSFVQISIHAPHAGSDSEPAGRRERSVNFYPRSPCGERLLTVWQVLIVLEFLSTLPMRGATLSASGSVQTQTSFLSTLPMRGATAAHTTITPSHVISIHAPHAGSDHCDAGKKSITKHFYPRSPCGERRIRPGSTRQNKNFYPRSPCGERQQT